MAKLLDGVWLWGQNPGSHHVNPDYRLPGKNVMTPVEGCEFFGIDRCCRVAMGAGPYPPFDAESAPLDKLHSVVWSIVGAGSVQYEEGKLGDLDEVLRQAEKHPNIVGGIMDDFLQNEARRALFSPAVLREVKNTLRTAIGRPLEYWTVYYEREMDLDVQEFLDVFDVITFWTWYGENLWKLEENLDTVISNNPGKRLYCGCYLWDYGNGKPLTAEQMQHQLDVYYKYIKAGKVSGIIICSNCCADLGLETVPQMKAFLAEHGNEDI
ncbi:MAG: hypothetical protein IKD23_02965 [Lentisphaeria bacterium]|nr:hypothetical protein [Lentisphaeria bacterium]